jgi:hypothetical protein
MSRNYIEFISAYCDSWCERCAFTERCSHYAVQCAEAMCDGDFQAALELAIGRAPVPGGDPPKTLLERMADAGFGEEPSQKELDQIGREMEERETRVRQHPLADASKDYGIASDRWLDVHRESGEQADAAVREAIDIIGWDSHLIHVKIMRALNGRDEDPTGSISDGPLQSDWNGSAKVALLSLERSERAWQVVARALGNDGAAVLAEHAGRLRKQMMTEFPRAMDFRRPGFDDPYRAAR